MSAKTILCECPICEKEFMARADQLRSAVASGREVPCCSRECEEERRHGAYRDMQWQKQQEKLANGLAGK